MPSSTKHSEHNNRGFTVVELLVGSILLSIMVLGMSNLWVVVDDYFFRLQLRQKAVLVVNGEVERLSALGRFTGLLAQPATYADSATTLERWVYRADPPGVATNLVVEIQTLNVINLTTFNEDQILFYNSNTGSNAAGDENIVWLDRTNNVTAKLEWQVLAADTSRCFGAGCFRVEARLSYPYRYEVGVAPARTSMGSVSTVSIRTMLGQRL